MTAKHVAREERDRAMARDLAEGSTQAEVGRRYGITPGAVSMAMTRLRKAGGEAPPFGKRGRRPKGWTPAPAPATAPAPRPIPPAAARRRATLQDLVEQRQRASDHARETRALARPLACPATAERYYDDEEARFLAACVAYADRYKPPIMEKTEYLYVFKSLGYHL